MAPETKTTDARLEVGHNETLDIRRGEKKKELDPTPPNPNK